MFWAMIYVPELYIDGFQIWKAKERRKLIELPLLCVLYFIAIDLTSFEVYDTSVGF